jgi:hypothetical protein
MIELDFGELSQIAEQVKLIAPELLRGAMLPTGGRAGLLFAPV